MELVIFFVTRLDGAEAVDPAHRGRRLLPVMVELVNRDCVVVEAIDRAAVRETDLSNRVALSA